MQVSRNLVPRLFPVDLSDRGERIAKRLIYRDSLRVSDGIRTHDRLDHNQELYQLSYAHHVLPD